MPRFYHISIFIIRVLLFVLIPIQVIAQTSPYPIKIKQPNGVEIEILAAGNMEESYTETSDGYTLLKNKANYFVYAKKGKKGRLIASDIIALPLENRTKKETQFLNRTPKHLRYMNKLKNSSYEKIYN